MLRPAAFLLFTALAAGSLHAESLAELAARERAKRDEEAKTPRPARVYGDDDLKKSKTPTPEGAEVTPEPTQAPVPAESGPSGASLAEEHEGRRREWLERSKNVFEQLAQARAAVAAIQARLDVLKSASHPTRPFGRGNPEVPVAEEEMAEAKEKLAAALQAKSDLDRDAAQNRIPSRWLQD